MGKKELDEMRKNMITEGKVYMKKIISVAYSELTKSDDDAKETNKKVIVMGFVSYGKFHNDTVKNPLTEWVSGLKKNERLNIPHELIDDMGRNGWIDAEGNNCFPEDYQPLPVKGEDGNVYLFMNDATMRTPAGLGYFTHAQLLLHNYYPEK